MAKVKNLHEGARKPARYDSWKDYWEAKTNRSFGLCSCVTCNSKAEHGSHVIRVDCDDHRWYIVPLCAAHNNPYNDRIFTVLDADLVPEND